jgi:hypothetical protein
LGQASGIAKEKKERQVRKRQRHAEYDQRGQADGALEYYSARQKEGFVNVN